MELYLLLMEDRGGNEYCSCPVDGHRVIRNQGWMNRSLEAMQETHITCKHLRTIYMPKEDRGNVCRMQELSYGQSKKI